MIVGHCRSQHRIHPAGARGPGNLCRIHLAGIDFPGIAGAILALLGLSSLSILPINWAGVALLVLSIALFVLEAKFTSHGMLGIGGTISMVLGALLLVNGPPEMRIHLSTALAVALPFAAITMFLVSIVIKARHNKVLTGVGGNGGGTRHRADGAGAGGASAGPAANIGTPSLPSSSGRRARSRQGRRGFKAAGRTGLTV